MSRNLFAIVKRIIQKRKASENPISKGALNQYTISNHAIERMLQREISPKKFIETIDNGRQIQEKEGGVFFIVHFKTVAVVLNTREKEIVTVKKNDKYLNWNISDFQREKRKDLITSSRELTVKDLRLMNTIDDLNNRFESLKKILKPR